MVQVLLKRLHSRTNGKVLHDSGKNSLLVAASCYHVQVVAGLSSLESIALETFHAMLTSAKKGKSKKQLTMAGSLIKVGKGIVWKRQEGTDTLMLAPRAQNAEGSTALVL
jgi:hypothetical protein